MTGSSSPPESGADRPTTKVESIAPARSAAFIFVFITVLLDMLALGIVVPVLPRLVVDFVHGDAARGADYLGGCSAPCGR